MGLRDAFRVAKGMTEAMVAVTDHWAEIVSIAPGRGRTVRVELEVHDGLNEPSLRWVKTKVPRGRVVQPGDHVNFSRHSVENADDLYSIEWSIPPRHGSPERRAALERAFGDIATGDRERGLRALEETAPDVVGPARQDSGRVDPPVGRRPD